MATSPIQQLYVAYFGRPVDPVGNVHWELILAAQGGTSAGIAMISAQFASSSEFVNLYAGMTDPQKVDAVYLNLFGRHAEADGLGSWSRQLSAGVMTLAQIITAVAERAGGTDLDAYNSKLTAATAFTTNLDLTEEISGYSGAAANLLAKAWLAGITDATSLARETAPDALNATIQSVIAPTAGANVPPVGSVAIAGVPTQGQTLTASNNLTDADGLGSISYQWKADNIEIAGATASTFTLVRDQVGKAITVNASYTDLGGTTESRSSASTSVVLGYQSGTSGADMVIGTAYADTLLGLDGNDALTGNSGNDTIVGGAGIDTAIFTGTRADHNLTKTATGWTISSAADGSDSLANIERLQFSDTNVALDISGVGGQAYRLYQAAFNRTPDQGGLGFWISMMDKGQATLNEVARGFVTSAEYKAAYTPGISNLDLVNKYYVNILGRPAEPGGLGFWVGVLDNHQATVPEVLAAISESSENQAALVGVIGNGFPFTSYGG